MYIDKELLQKTIKSMDWMLLDIDYKNQLNDKVEDSPEVIDAKNTLTKLKQLDSNQEKHYVQNG